MNIFFLPGLEGYMYKFACVVICNFYPKLKLCLTCVEAVAFTVQTNFICEYRD